MVKKGKYYPEARKYEKEFIKTLDSEKACEYMARTAIGSLGDSYRALCDYCKWLEEQVEIKMGYDFSKLSTQEIKKAISDWEENRDKGWKTVFYYLGEKIGNNQKMHELLKAELRKRNFRPWNSGEDISKLITEETMEEYKDITLDMSVREIMELDFDRVEYWCGEEFGFNRFAEKKEWFSNIISALKRGYKYRYKLKPLEPIRITKKLNDLMFEKNLTGAIYDNKVMIRFEGRKVEIIGEESNV